MCQNDFCPLFFKIRSLQNKIISSLNPRNSITNSLPNLPLLAHSLFSVFVKKHRLRQRTIGVSETMSNAKVA